MLLATVLALASAVVHAGWNLAIKTSTIDRFIALWGQFLVAASIGAVALVVFGGLTWRAWPYALASGVVHIGYVTLLARAYRLGDFSLAYPIARGGGAVLAALGGVVVLGDRFSALSWVGLALAGAGLLSFARRKAGAGAVAAAAMLAVDIAIYSVVDARGSRLAVHATYVFGNTVADGFFVSMYGLAAGRAGALAAAARTHWRRIVVNGIATIVVSTLVLTAVRYAPVGHVSALRESSVVLAAFAGWRLLGESLGRARIVSSIVVVVGLVVLIIGGG